MKNKPSRRSFLQNSALTAAGFMILPRHVLGRGFKAPSDKLNIALQSNKDILLVPLFHTNYDFINHNINAVDSLFNYINNGYGCFSNSKIIFCVFFYPFSGSGYATTKAVEIIGHYVGVVITYVVIFPTAEHTINSRYHKSSLTLS